MKYKINLLKVPNQKLSCNLANNNGDYITLDISLRTLPDGLLIADLTVNNEIQRLSAIVHNNMPLLPTNTVGGNVYFNDIYGDNDPIYTDFNDRYQLIYDSNYILS